MDRLLGLRPSFARERLGWQWVIEAWLLRERECGGLQQRLRGDPVEGDVEGKGIHVAAPNKSAEDPLEGSVDGRADGTRAERNGAAA
jgi:hypothetical protein